MEDKGRKRNRGLNRRRNGSPGQSSGLPMPPPLSSASAPFVSVAFPPPATRARHLPPEAMNLYRVTSPSPGPSPSSASHFCTFAQELRSDLHLCTSSLPLPCPHVPSAMVPLLRSMPACQQIPTRPRPRLPLPILNPLYPVLSYFPHVPMPAGPLNLPSLFLFQDHNPHSTWR